MKTYFSIKSILTDNILLQKVQNSSKSKISKKEAPLSPRELLLADIVKTQHALETAYSGFDNATDPDLIDCYIYEVNSALKRYRFLLGQAQRMQLFISDADSTISSMRLITPNEVPSTPSILSFDHN